MTPPRKSTLFPYQLPSGSQVVGNIDNFDADHGTLMTAVELSEKGYPVVIEDPDQEVVCRLPSGLAVVETFGNAQKDEGTVLGKIIPFRPEGASISSV